MTRLKSRVAIVTGSAQGIGKGIAGALASAGALVALWDINDLVHETSEDINRLGGKAFSYVVNVTDPYQVKDAAEQIENKLGRERTEEKWQSRTIDLDILLYNKEIIDTEKLTIPHKQMHLRSFVLKGLYELNPQLQHPVLG